jgi:gas vesicle protein
MGCSGRKPRKLSTLLFGMIIGLVIGLMIAPRPGAEIIDRLRG